MESEDVTEELEHQESLLENKIRYLTLVKESIAITREKMKSGDELSLLMNEFKNVFAGYMKEFHDQSKSHTPKKRTNKNSHGEAMKIFRKIAAEKGGEREDYLKLLEYNPQLRDKEYLSKYFVMLRLSKSNNFKLDEIDNLEKNIKRFIKFLDSDIM